jgi:hypothetical protein
MAPADQETEAGEATLLVRSWHFLSVICLVVALVAYLFNLWVSRLVPSLSADSLIYHLTIPAVWTQRGFLHEVDLPFHDGAAEHSPLLTETIVYGLMKMTGSDDLAWLVQPAFFLLMAALFHRSLSLLGLAPATARFLTAFVLLFSPFFHSSLIVNSEMVMTCGVAAFCYGMLLTGTRREAGCYIAAAGIALTTASKTVGVIYGSLAVLVLAGWFVAQMRGTKDAVQLFRWRQTAALCFVILLCGLVFQFRNLVRYGNPLYPAELGIAGIPLLPGRYNAAVFINHGWSPAAFSKMLLYDTESHAMNRQFGIVLWLAMLVPPIMLILRRWKTADLLPALLLVIYPLASIVIYFAVVPFWSEHRLLFPVYYLLWLNLGWSVCLLTREAGKMVGQLIAAGVGLACVVYALFFLFFDEAPFWLLGCGGALGIVLANYPRLLDLAGRKPWAIPAVVVVLFAAGSPWWYPQLKAQRVQASQSAYARMYGPQGKAWSRLIELTADQPATIAYSGNALNFPLFGPQLANRVVYLPIHPRDQPAPIQLGEKESIYLQLARQRRTERDEKFWLEQLRKQQVNYLLLVSDPKFGGVEAERTFASHNPGLLHLVYEQDGVWIYAVK